MAEPTVQTDAERRAKYTQPGPDPLTIDEVSEKIRLEYREALRALGWLD